MAEEQGRGYKITRPVLFGIEKNMANNLTSPD
jgi:hypothetical protein